MTTVLVVEDDALLAESLRALLESGGHRALVARDGPSGIELARSEKPAVVVLDAMLPGVSGFEVCRLLRADAGLRGLRVLMLTALDGLGDMDRAFAAGVDDFAPKPLDGPTFLDKVARLLGPARGQG